MIFLRIRHRFHQRASEWFCAANMLQFGLTLMHKSQTFDSPAYTAFRWLGEAWTGAAVGSCGFVWLCGLIVNGARQRVTSTIRAWCAFVGALVYGLLALGFLWSFKMTNLLSTGIGNYALVSVLALYALFHVMRDKREQG
ncbi:hypothetical protein [Aurantimonas sp. 22II-16-19i]|uniref:hypothetical protein n=1 Tax=Aurantimonas sp. 22II-16-19i TaxID=1317114 RepID=UPI0009F7AC84|nr:hypothetical protein [Aurantimonas sp. 22II-16-19i]ORE85308.1 hypothetical protein ATO4_26523 [Aurantimonas sp. 22II-16-19i]